MSAATAAPSRTATRTVVHQLADLAASIRTEDLPAEVVHAARRRLLDSVGVMLAGASGHTVQVTRAAASALGGVGEATFVGASERAPVDRATLVNSTALRYLDYMDGHPGPYPSHACFNIPPILAVAEQTGASGRDVVRAIVLGYETQIRMQLAAGTPSITEHGWAGASNLGVSVPVAVSGLLDLSADQTAHALAVSMTHMAALEVSSKGQIAASKSCVDGLVAMSSVVAAYLARAGLTGPRLAFEGSGGYAEAISRRLDLDLLLAPVERFRILDVYDKRYNAGKYGQTVVAAGLTALQSVPGGWRNVEQITIRLAERDCEQQLEHPEERRRPETRDTANHSIYFCLAAALVDGDLLPAQLAEDRLHDPDILSVVDRITLAADAELTSHWPATNPAEVVLVARDGSVHSERIIHPPGHARNPLSDAALEAKFRGLVAPVVSKSAADAIVELTMRLEQLPTIRQLTDLLRVEAQA